MGKLASLPMIVCVSLAVILLIGSSVCAAESKMGTPGSGGCPAGPQEQAGDPRPVVGCGMKCQEHCQEMMGMPMMGECPSMMPMMHQTTGPMMPPLGMGMKGMMGGAHDPKAIGRMLQMRGDVLKAVGEVLYKYGKEMAGEGK